MNDTAHLSGSDFVTINLIEKNISIHASYNPITSKFGLCFIDCTRKKVHNTGYMMTLLRTKMIKKFHMSEALYC